MILARLMIGRSAAEAKASLNRAYQLESLDAKLSDLPLSRMKVW